MPIYKRDPTTGKLIGLPSKKVVTPYIPKIVLNNEVKARLDNMKIISEETYKSVVGRLLKNFDETKKRGGFKNG